MIASKVAALLRNAGDSLNLNKAASRIVAALLRNASTKLNANKAAGSLGPGIAEQCRHYSDSLLGSHRCFVSFLNRLNGLNRPNLLNRLNLLNRFFRGREAAATLTCSLIAALVSLTSCRHRDFCMHHPEHTPSWRTLLKATYRLEWEIPHETDPYAFWRSSWPEVLPMAYDDQLPIVPEGLRVVTFPPDNATPYFVNLEPHGGEIRFNAEGRHSMLMFNNDTEYIQFDGLGSFATSRATTRARNRSTYTGNRYYLPGRSEGETTLAPPDMVFGQFSTSHFPRSLTLEQAALPDELLEVEMQPLVFTYVVHYRFSSGAQFVSQARGALAGMAQGVWLCSGTTTDEAATLLYDCTVSAASQCVTACVRSFGIPGYPKSDYSRSPGAFALNLDLCLANGKVVTYEWDVTDQVARQPHGGVILVDGIHVEEEDAKTYGSGFTVDVTDWGDDEPIEF